MTNPVHTFCRICEPECPLVVDVDGAGRAIRLRPDFEHPCGGIACHKGLSFLDVHNDPDRLNWPLKRQNSRSEARGQFEETDWDTAMAEMGAKMGALRERYGPNSIAFYMSNPAAFNATALLMSTRFQDIVGTQMRFSATTLDMSNKIYGAGAIYGSSSAFMVPDIYNTDYLLVLGSNPKVSRWTIFSAPNDMDVVKRIQDRGGQVRFVNPRKIESSTVETGQTLRIKPGADAYFLAAVLHEIERLHGFDEEVLTRWGKNVEGLRQFIHRYPPERVTRAIGIDVDTIREVATGLRTAKSASIYMSTGLNQSRQGILCYWLVEMISLVTGNLGRKGGSYKPPGLINFCPPAGATQQVETSMGTFEMPAPFGHLALPMTLLPDLIDNGDIRALIFLGGNPLLSAGGEEKLRSAFEKLELMVSIDLYRNASAELCDYVLPATDWLERPDINLLGNGMQAIPYVHYTDAIEPPAAGRRNEWWILSRLLQAMGLPSPLDAQPEPLDDAALLNGILAAGALSIDALRQAPHQSVVLAQEPRDALFERCLQHPDKKIDCCPEAFSKAGLFERCDTLFDELENEPPGTLRLITLRTTHMHNSWLSNTERFRHGKHAVNPLNICEHDAAVLGLHEGDAVRVSSRYGAIETRVLINDDLRPGAVAMSHGYGHQASYGLKVASAKPGVNYNRLTPSGPGISEPLSNMSWLTALPVKVERVEHAGFGFRGDAHDVQAEQTIG